MIGRPKGAGGVFFGFVCAAIKPIAKMTRKITPALQNVTVKRNTTTAAHSNSILASKICKNTILRWVGGYIFQIKQTISAYTAFCNNWRNGIERNALDHVNTRFAEHRSLQIPSKTALMKPNYDLNVNYRSRSTIHSRFQKITSRRSCARTRVCFCISLYDLTFKIVFQTHRRTVRSCDALVTILDVCAIRAVISLQTR